MSIVEPDPFASGFMDFAAFNDQRSALNGSGGARERLEARQEVSGVWGAMPRGSGLRGAKPGLLCLGLVMVAAD